MKYDKQENFVYDHEKQMRYFNDTMNALALNAYEINDFNEQIAHTLDVRNQKLKNMENYTSNLEESINKMEKLLNKIMESI